MIPTDGVSQVRWLEVLNDAGEDIPPYAVVRVSGEDGGLLKVAKPNGVLPATYLFNGPFGIPKGLKGMCHAETPARVAFDPAQIPPGGVAVGQMWGPVVNGWKVRYGRPGFVVTASPSGGGLEGGHVTVMPWPRGTEVVRVTAGPLTGLGVPAGRFYSGFLSIYQAPNSSWGETAAKCYVLGTEGEELGFRHYLCHFAGLYATDGVPVYGVAHSLMVTTTKPGAQKFHGVHGLHFNEKHFLVHGGGPYGAGVSVTGASATILLYRYRCGLTGLIQETQQIRFEDGLLKEVGSWE